MPLCLFLQYLRLSLGGYVGLKGAVSVRFGLYGASVCLVNSHLSAHDHQLELRLQEQDICAKGLKFAGGSNRRIADHE